MIKTTRDKIFGNQEYTLVTSIFKLSLNYVKTVTLEHNGKEIMQYVEGGHKFYVVSIQAKKDHITIITPILNRWKTKYEYEFKGINFPDEESLCLFLMELANEI